jgi:hypothetical protein
MSRWSSGRKSLELLCSRECKLLKRKLSIKQNERHERASLTDFLRLERVSASDVEDLRLKLVVILLVVELLNADPECILRKLIVAVENAA